MSDVESLKLALNPAQRTRAAVNLRAAAALIVERGWWQKSSDGPDGQVCLSAAIERAASFGSGSVRCNGFGCEICLAQAAFLHFVGQGPVGWNDDQERTMAEVLTTVEACATWLDELAKEE